MNKKTVLVVDDSAFMRKMISDIINRSNSLEVLDTARNGKDAMEKRKKLRPDVITLDIEMPLIDGIAALQEIMKEDPLPVVMLSSLTKTGADKTIEAMTLGAVDFITKPSGSISLNIRDIESEIIKKVEQAAQVQLPETKKNTSWTQVSYSTKKMKGNNSLVAIGSSTGGPRALQNILTSLSKNFSAPIVIVQHMPKGFTKSLAERLNRQSQIEVKEVRNGEMLENGVAYIAEGGKQFQVVEKEGRFVAQVDKKVPVNGHQPSVDTLFHSISLLTNCHPIAIVLTGMGKDGATGIKQLKRRHPRTLCIAQSKETCVVYGMPQAAEKTSLVDYIIDLDEISQMLQHKIQ
ncbi:chemotaxis response regulator protein-glutamate methylesterase [Gracilibacillus sp. YIM 98692]|uniref:protein-glutamate methylesterase/protein-glutamine glutaminase n=1 Tax=Gracilibacillus sp. YIM 98692 TaxID=2663532 RepID=UPI0013D74B7D|nr:chemotaxis response regulator protein-glutamate methylesterase [Gracilibacillus sp. YIM 98692]